MSTPAKDPARPHRATPYLCCRDAARAIEFYRAVFDATETMRLAEPSGRIGHAEIRIGESTIMLSDEYPEMGVRGPESLGGTPVMIHLYVPDVDATATRAAAAGAIIERAVEDQFYGDRAGTLRDPCGHRWMIATRIADVPEAEMQRRYDELMKR